MTREPRQSSIAGFRVLDGFDPDTAAFVAWSAIYDMPDRALTDIGRDCQAIVCNRFSKAQ